MRRTQLATVVVLIASTGVALAAPWEASGIDWTRPPAAAPRARFAPPKPVRHLLPNGVQLLIVENRALPLFSASVVVLGAGSAYDPDGQGGLAAFTADLLDEGAAGLGALALGARLESLGATLDTGIAPDSARLELSGLARNLDASLHLLTEVLARPLFDAPEAARVHADLATDLALKPDRPREVASDLLIGRIYGCTSAYGHPADGTMASHAPLTVADARSFHARAYRPDRTTIIVAGDVNAAALTKLFARQLGTFGSASPQPAINAAPTVLLGRGPRLLLVDRPGAEQSDVRIGVAAIAPGDLREPALEVLANALGGSFTSRLNRRLREELAYTYGIRAGVGWRAGVSPFVISTSLFTPNTIAGLREILRIVGEVSAAELPKEELHKAKQNLVQQLPQSFQTNGATTGAFAELVRHGRPLDWYDGYAERIDAVTGAQVKDAAATLVPVGGLLFTVAGDLTALREGLNGLGLGRSALLGADGGPRR